MNTIKWIATDYVRADETIETAIVNGERVIYMHFKNGYYSLIEGLGNLMSFLNGEVSERFACVDSYSEVDRILTREI